MICMVPPESRFGRSLKVGYTPGHRGRGPAIMRLHVRGFPRSHPSDVVNRLLKASASVGCANTASRSTVYGRRPALHVAQGVDAGDVGFQPLIHLDEAGLVGLDACGTQVERLRIGRPAGREQEMRA